MDLLESPFHCDTFRLDRILFFIEWELLYASIWRVFPDGYFNHHHVFLFCESVANELLYTKTSGT